MLNISPRDLWVVIVGFELQTQVFLIPLHLQADIQHTFSRELQSWVEGCGVSQGSCSLCIDGGISDGSTQKRGVTAGGRLGAGPAEIRASATCSWVNTFPGRVRR